MQKLISTLFFIFILACATTLPVQGQDWANKMFNGFDHDFGLVARGARPIHKFTITNSYKEQLRILGVTSSCGCTTATLSKNTIDSEETIELICQFNSDVGPGFKQATVRVRFAEPFPAEVQVVVKGTIRNDVMLEPAQLDFGTFSAGKSPQITTTITQFGNPNWSIVDVRSLYPHVGVALAQQYRGQDKVVYNLTANIKESAPSDRIQDELILLVSSDGGRTTTQMRVPFTGKVSAPLTVNPEVLSLSDVQAGEEVVRRVILKGAQEFRLVDVTCEDQDFTVRADGKSKKVHFVEIVFKGNTAGNHDADLNFITDLNTRTTVTMKALANVVTEAAENQLNSLDR